MFPALSVTEQVYVKVPVEDGLFIPSGEFEEPLEVETPEIESVPEHEHGKLFPV